MRPNANRRSSGRTARRITGDAAMHEVADALQGGDLRKEVAGEIRRAVEGPIGGFREKQRTAGSRISKSIKRAFLE